jgi:hypothetical protein
MHDNILLYASPNGDRWYFVRDADPERLSVRHEPNRASGGQPVTTELRHFWPRDTDLSMMRCGVTSSSWDISRSENKPADVTLIQACGRGRLGRAERLGVSHHVW